MKIRFRKPWLVGLTLLAVVIGGGFWIYKAKSAKTVTKQVTEKVQKGTIIQSITGSGSVIAKIQSTATVSGKARVEKLLVKDGDEVEEDQTLLLVKSLATEEEIAKSYANLLSSQSSLLSAQQSLVDAQKNQSITATKLTNSEVALKKAKIDAKKTIIDAKVTVANASSTQDAADSDIKILVAQLGSKSADYSMQSAMLSAKSSLLTADSNLQEAKSTAEAAVTKTKIAEQSLAVADANLKQTQLAYKSLTDQEIKSPASGTVMGLSLIEGSVIGSSGSSTSSTSAGSTSTSTTTSNTSLFTIVNLKSLRAQVSINEVDVPNVKIGQPATLTFDSLSDKTLTGKVASIDKLGSTTSGVTTYTAEITFDSIEDGILPGMSVSASIITAQKDNALLISGSAIGTNGDNDVVTVIKNGTTSSVVVTTGISNDSQTEILTGLSEGDEVVTSTTVSTTGTFSSKSSNSSSRNSSRSSSGVSSMMGGMGGNAGGPPGM